MTSWSHPAWVCGLKLLVIIFATGSGVTPCVGVWIETWTGKTKHQKKSVTPCVGVWIETCKLLDMLGYGSSHPAWVCGLKQLKKRIILLNLSHTLRGCVD